MTRAAVIHRIIKNVLAPTERAATFCDNGISGPKGELPLLLRRKASKVGMGLCKKLNLGERRERAVAHAAVGLGSLGWVPRY